MRAERLAALALAAALAGCAHAPQRPSAAAAGGAPPPGAGEERQALALLAWLETARADLAAAEARNATLERQLEALKDIERSIRERGRAAGNGRRGDGTRTRPSR